MAKNEAKIRFTAETGGFNKEIQKSNKEMAELRAEMNLNETQMKSTGVTVEGLEKKHSILEQQLKASESKTEALNQKVQKAVKIFGENSDEASKLKIQLLNAQNAEEKLRQAVSKCESELEGQRKQSQDNRTAFEQLTDTIDEQRSEVDRLKNEYKDAVLQYGKNSKEAKDLANQIDSLSDELDSNSKRMKSTENAADKLDNSLDNVDEATEEAIEGFTVMKGAMADLVADGIEAVISGFADMATGAFAMSNDIKKATNNFIAQTGLSSAAAENFEDVMVDIYNDNFGESFDDIAKSMADVRNNIGNMDNGALKKTTKNAILLRDTFEFEVSESTRAASMLMTQFGIDSETAFSLITQGAQSGLNKNGDLLDIITEYSVQFKDAGYDAEEMFAMLVNGTNAGTWSVDKLGDAVKEFNIRASDGTVGEAIKENAKAFGLTKKEAEALAAEIQGGSVESYQKLRDKLSEVDDDTQRYQLGVAMFGTMWEDLGEKTVMALLETESEITATTDSLNDLNDVKYDDLGSAIEGIKRNLETNIAEPIKENVMPAINEFVEDVDWQEVGETIGEAFGTVVEKALAFVDALKKTVQWMSEHKAVAITLAAVIGTIATAVEVLTLAKAAKVAMDKAEVTSIGALIAAHWSQAAAGMAALAPYLLIVAAIAAVIAIIVLCIKYWDEIVAAVKKCWDAVCQTLSGWGEWINTNVIQPIGKFFSGLWDGIVTAAKTAWDGVTAFFSGVAEWFNTKVIQPIVQFFVNLWDGIKTVWDGICNVVQFAFMFIGSLISAAFNIITLPFRLIWENCKQYVFAAWDWIKNAVSTAINAVKNVIMTVMNAVSTFFSNVWNAIKNTVSNVWNSIVSFLTPIINGIKNTITTAFNAVKNTVTTIFNAVKNTVLTVWNAIKTAVTTAVNAVKETISTVFNAIKNTATNVWNGIKNTVSNVANGIKNTVSSVFNGIKTTATNVWNNVKNAMTKPIEAARDKIKGVIDKIKGFFSNLKLKFPNIKMPHFKITGKFSLDPPSVPKLGIEWYKDGGIMMKPTIFGMNGNSLMAGGEAGPEAILPIDRLEGYISGAIEKAQNVVNLQSLADAIEDLANRPIQMNINGRQFATATAYDSDGVNGLRTTFKNRGLALG